MKKLLFVFMTISFDAVAVQPLIKIGSSCPSGYSTSGSSYCNPNGNAHDAIIKIGNSCPTGYSTSGNSYCLSSSDNSRTAIPKQGGNCPSGYSTSGSSYCLSNK